MRCDSVLAGAALVLLASAGSGSGVRATELAPSWMYSVLPWSVIDTDIDPEEAEVWLDGEMIGTADDFDGWPEKLEVPPGQHRLEFRLKGYRTLRVDLDADPGAYYQFDRILRPAEASGDEDVDVPPDSAWVRLTVQPADAAIFIDGKRIDADAIDPAEGTILLSPGMHLFELVRPGYEPLRREFELGAGETLALSLRLEKIEGQ